MKKAAQTPNGAPHRRRRRRPAGNGSAPQAQQPAREGKACSIRLLSVDGGVGARLLAAYPAYRACVIPAGTYAGQGEDVWTVSVQALLLASNALSDETVQRLTARYFDSVDAVAAAVPGPLVTDPAVAAAQSVIPYHTGAAAYYTAQGITPAGPETGASPEQEAAA